MREQVPANVVEALKLMYVVAASEMLPYRVVEYVVGFSVFPFPRLYIRVPMPCATSVPVVVAEIKAVRIDAPPPIAIGVMVAVPLPKDMLGLQPPLTKSST